MCKFPLVFQCKLCLSCTVSEIKRDIGRKSRFFIPHLHSTPTLGGFRWNILITFDAQKLERWGFQTPMVKKSETMFTHFDIMRERDRQTDIRTPHDGVGRAVHGVARQKCFQKLVGLCTRAKCRQHTYTLPAPRAQRRSRTS